MLRLHHFLSSQNTGFSAQHFADLASDLSLLMSAVLSPYDADVTFGTAKVWEKSLKVCVRRKEIAVRSNRNASIG